MRGNIDDKFSKPGRKKKGIQKTRFWTHYLLRHLVVSVIVEALRMMCLIWVLLFYNYLKTHEKPRTKIHFIISDSIG